MQKREILTSFIFIILMTSLVSSTLTASIGSPRMVLYENISAGEKINIKESVIVKNENLFPVLIEVTPTGIWKDKIELISNNFTLESNSEREVFYNIRIDKAGYYEGDLIVVFKQESEKKEVALAQDLVVIVNPVEKQSKNILLPIVVGVIGILIILVILKIIKKK